MPAFWRPWLFLLGLFCLPAQAQFSAGIGFSASQSPYQGVSSNPNTIPAYVNYQGQRLYLRGTELGFALWQQGDRQQALSLNVIASGRLAGYHASDSAFLTGMATRRWSLDGGLALSGRYQQHLFSIKAVHDLLDHHQGYEVNGYYGYLLRLHPRWAITPGFNLSWQSDDLVDYYFGVRPEEARNERAAYQAAGGLESQVSLMSLWQVSERQQLIAIARVRYLASEVRKSPLVDRRHTSGVFLGYILSF